MARTKQTALIATTVASRATIAKKAGAKVPAAPKQPATASSSPAPVIKKKRRVSPGTKADREIRRLQKGTNPLIPKACINRYIREVIEARREKQRSDGDDTPLKVQASAFAALQVAAEDTLVRLLAKTRTFMRHAKRETIMRPDIRLAAKEMGLTKHTIID